MRVRCVSERVYARCVGDDKIGVSYVGVGFALLILLAIGNARASIHGVGNKIELHAFFVSIE